MQSSPSKDLHPDWVGILACGFTYSLRLPSRIDQWPCADFALEKESPPFVQKRLKGEGITAHSCGAAMDSHHLPYLRRSHGINQSMIPPNFRD